MEDFLYRPDNIHGSKGSMGDSHNDKASNDTLAHNEEYNFSPSFFAYYYHSLFTQPLKIYKTKMATLTFKWIMYQIFGGGAFLYGLILSIVPPKVLADIQLGDIKEPWKTIVIIFGLLWVGQRIYSGYQTGRSKQIENDERQHELNEKKNHAKHLHEQH